MRLRTSSRLKRLSYSQKVTNSLSKIKTRNSRNTLINEKNGKSFQRKEKLEKSKFNDDIKARKNSQTGSKGKKDGKNSCEINGDMKCVSEKLKKLNKLQTKVQKCQQKVDKKSVNSISKKNKVALRTRSSVGQNRFCELVQSSVERKRRQLQLNKPAKYNQDISDLDESDAEQSSNSESQTKCLKPKVSMIRVNNNTLKELNELSPYVKHFESFKRFFTLYNELYSREKSSPSFFQKSLSFVSSNSKHAEFVDIKIKKEFEDSSYALIEGCKSSRLVSQLNDSSQWNIIIEPIKLDHYKHYSRAILDFFLIRKFYPTIDTDDYDTTSSDFFDKKMFCGTLRIDFSKENNYKKIVIPANLLLNFEGDVKSLKNFRFYLATTISYCSGDLVLLNLKKNDSSKRSQVQFLFKTEIQDLFCMGAETYHKMELTSCLKPVKEQFKFVNGSNPQNIITPNHEWVVITPDDLFYSHKNFDNFYKLERYMDNMYNYPSFTYYTIFLKKSNNRFDSSQFNRKCFLKTRQFLKELPINCINSIDMDAFFMEDLNVNKCKVFYRFDRIQSNTIMLDFRCPICKMNFVLFDNLAIHLNYSHSRFKFKILKSDDGNYKVNVSINEKYDTSTEDNPWRNSRLSHARTKHPNRRVFQTEMLVFNQNKKLDELVSYKSSDKGLQINIKNADVMQSRKRIFYHSQTCIPILASELDQDSENEDYSQWLQERKESLIDEFIDVNSGEKCLIKMWNSHINGSRKSLIGDRHIPNACISFVEKYGEQLVQKRLRNNFLFHLINLHHFTLIPAEMIVNLMERFKQIETKYLNSHKIL